MSSIRLMVALAMVLACVSAGCSDDGAPPVCGDGMVDPGEACDDGNNANGDGCSATCMMEDDGVCGDGTVDAAEVCDDGNTADGDGCSADCQSDETCGNGIRDDAAGEQCDDGSTDPGDGCSATCMVEECGNGVDDPGEVCDDSNTMDGDGCSANCMSDETCGNDVVDMAVGETCDDGNAMAGDGCSDTCQMEGCGNGTLDPGEACDDDNNNDGDGCSANCLSDETCGNGIEDGPVGEVCDDSNMTDGDGCSADCRSDETCGNGVVDMSVGEVCDDDNTNDGDGCSANCMSDETCGNGIVDPGEQCDDGNVLGGDLCSATCADECVADPDLAVQDDGSSANGAVGLPDLVMSEINPGDYIELWNTTGADIDLGAVNHQLCSRPAYRGLSVLAPDVVVPAHGYASIPWPANFTDVDAGGEVMLYSGAAFGDSTTILDFVCWGTNPHASRKNQAETIGKWSGACNAPLTNGAIHRNVSSTGIMAVDYDTVSVPSEANCVVVP